MSPAPPSDPGALLDEQAAHYRARAPEYDEWWLRTGRYDRGPEALAINQARLAAAGLAPARHVEADLFAWQPDALYDVVFFSFWLSHVPEDRFERFWQTVGAALRLGGRAFLIDSLPDETSTARDHRMPDEDGRQERRLNDGRSFQIVKLFRGPADLTARLSALGWTAELSRTATYFVHGHACRP